MSAVLSLETLLLMDAAHVGGGIRFGHELDWQLFAACRQSVPTKAVDNFFPGRGRPGRAAKSVCAVCPVREECLAWALAYDERGIWGGTSDAERRRLRETKSISQGGVS